jgi:hypothetical protein
VAVESAVPQEGSAWTVENIGTAAAALLRFTAPLPLLPAIPDVSGATGALCGLQVENGLVKSLPTQLVTRLSVAKTGAYANSFAVLLAPSTPEDACETRITFDLDGIVQAAQQGQLSLSTRIDAVENALTQVPASLFEIAAALGVVVLDATDLPVATARVPNLVSNTWQFPLAYVGQTVTGSNAGTAVVDATGRATLSALAYPRSVAP